MAKKSKVATNLVGRMVRYAQNEPIPEGVAAGSWPHVSR